MIHKGYLNLSEERGWEENEKGKKTERKRKERKLVTYRRLDTKLIFVIQGDFERKKQASVPYW